MTAIEPVEQTRIEFDALVRTHQSMVFSLIYHFLHDRDAADEIAQDVFLALHRNLESIQTADHAVFWLRRVAVQRAIDEARRRKRRPVVALEKIAEPAARDRGPGDPLLAEVLRRLIATLPEAPRSVMILRYQEDLDPSEIARLLEMPVGTVKSHLQRSLALLREKLERKGVG